MFNVGGPEILVILLVALVVLGPDQLPKAMRTFGNVMAEIRKVSGGFQDEMRKAMEQADPRTMIEGVSRSEPKVDSASQPAVSATATTAATPEEADVTEVVARNPLEPDTAPAADAIDPADRASG